jgi:Flp pilus assembly protein TadD/YHS domain-containing protein
MKAESIVFAIAGSLFGLIVGWMLGSQSTRFDRPAPVMPPAEQAAAAAGGAGQAAPQLDETRVQSLRTAAEQNPTDPRSRIDLGNLYFDAERYADAITWYEAALSINPKDPDVSTDLGVAYYYTKQPDKAVTQFQRSLAVDPKHTKTLLNLGIVKAFGKRDFTGAVEAFQQVIALAPDSPEGQAAKKALGILRVPEASKAMWLRTLLLFLLVVFLIRAVRRFMSGVVDGASAKAGGGPQRAHPTPVQMVADPVCGTFVVPGKALQLARGRQTVYFCSEKCRDQWVHAH